MLGGGRRQLTAHTHVEQRAKITSVPLNIIVQPASASNCRGLRPSQLRRQIRWTGTGCSCADLFFFSKGAPLISKDVFAGWQECTLPTRGFSTVAFGAPRLQWESIINSPVGECERDPNQRNHTWLIQAARESACPYLVVYGLFRKLGFTQYKGLIPQAAQAKGQGGRGLGHWQITM